MTYNSTGYAAFYNLIEGKDFSFINDQNFNINAFPENITKSRLDQAGYWLNNKFQRMREQLRFLYEISRQYPTLGNMQAYKYFKTVYKHTIKRAKTAANDKFFSSAANPTKS